MDLNTITIADFKTQFRRDFPFLPTYDNAKLYNAGVRVYYPTTELFYTCKVNGTTGILPTVTNNWEIVADSVDNYIADTDITNAFAEAKMTFNQALFSDDASIKLAFLYLAAHYLVLDTRAAMGGIYGANLFPLQSKSAGNVSESYGIPQVYLNDPQFSYLSGTAYGLKYLSFVWSLLTGNFGVVAGATTP